MTPDIRNRSEGWRHAKLDGHANEKLFAETLINDKEFISTIQGNILHSIPDGKPQINVDGSKHVASIFGDLTTSKVDLSIIWNDGQKINISLKKSNSGQVWLVSVPRFISAVEYYLNKKVDREVLLGLSLFIGGTNISDYEKYYEKALALNKIHNPKIAVQEIHQSRLVANSIENYFPTAWESLLDFFNANIALLTKLAFAQGLAKSEEDSADVIIYNKSVEDKSVFPIPRIIESSAAAIKLSPIKAGPKNGGSTLVLPTGFLQMHHPQGENLIQFHHQYKKIAIL